METVSLKQIVIFCISITTLIRESPTINVEGRGLYYDVYQGQRLDAHVLDVVEALSLSECVVWCTTLADRCNGTEWQPPSTCHLMADGGYCGNLKDKLVPALPTWRTALIQAPSYRKYFFHQNMYCYYTYVKM